MNELEFLRHILHKLEECGLEDTYLNDIIKCRRILEERINVVKNCSIPDVSNFVLLAKPNYKAKDGTIKRGIEIDGKYYAPQNDC